MLRGELDWIVMRAMEKDRNRRYESVSALAADVQRYLNDEPVQAAPPSRWYLAAKYIRRHKLAATVAALSCSLLAFGIGATAWQTFRATKAEQSAEERYEIAKEAVDTYLLEVTQDEQLASPAFQDLRRRLLESAEKFYDRLSRERPADLRQKSHKGAALHNLGKVHVETGKYGIAHQALERAAAIYEELLQEEPQSTAHVLDLTRVLESRGNLWCRQGDNGKAVPYFERSLALRTSLYSAAPSDPELAHALAEAQRRLGSIQWDERGRRNLAEATGLLTQVSTRHPESNAYQESLAQSHQEWAYHLEAASKQAACQHHEAAVAIYTRLAAANADSVKLQISLAVAQAQQGDTFHRFQRLEESRKCRLKAVEGLTRLAAKHPGRIDVDVQLGHMMHLLGQDEEELWLTGTRRSPFALEAIHGRYAAALKIHQRLGARFPQVVDFQVRRAATQAKVGEILAFQGRTDEGIRLLRESQQQLRRVQQETGGHADAREFLVSTHARLAEIHGREGQRGEADREWAAARALGVRGNEFSARFAKLERALAAFSAKEEFRELLRQMGGFIATTSGGNYPDDSFPRNLLLTIQDVRMKRLSSWLRFPRLDRSLLKGLDYRHRRLILEVLEDRSLLAGDISISDAMATEGASWFQFADAFVTAESGEIATPYGVLFGPDEKLYVTQLGFGGVKRFDGDTGAFIDVFADGSAVVNQASQMVFHGDYLFVATGSAGILRFDAATGAPVPAVGKPDAQFATPIDQGIIDGVHGLAFGADGHLYVTCNLDHQVLKYDGLTGEYLGVFVGAGSGGLNRANALVFGTDGHLYVASSGNSSVLRYQGPQESTPGAFIDVFVPSGSGGLSWIPTGGLQFRPDGDLYVVSRETSSILRFDGSTGAFRETVVAPGLGGVSSPRGFTFDVEGRILVNSFNTNEVLRFARASEGAFTVSLSHPSETSVSVNFDTANGTGTGSDYMDTAGTIIFTPGQTTRTILVQTVDNTEIEVNKTFTVNLSSPIGATIVDGTGVGTIIDNDTKFYVVDDGAANRTFEYGSFADGGGAGAAGESYVLPTGNAAPRGAASTAAGDKVWVVDANRNVFVYDAAGVLLGSWAATATGMSQPEGIATNGTDIWIVDAGADKVFKYLGAASRLSGTQNAAGNASFKLNSGNKDARDIVTDGSALWVVNNAASDKVFKYTLAGSLAGSWTISTPGAASPTGITLDPSNPSDLWIVDSGTDRVYQYDAAVNRTSGSLAASGSFALATGNANPQGIADPPVGGAPASEPAAEAPSVAGVLATSGTVQTLAETSETTTPTAPPLPSAPAASGTGLVAEGRRFMAIGSDPAVRTRAAASHDEAICSLADELEGLLPVRKLRR